MGKGLNPVQGGRHVAYAAGTGVLVFMDLVGHMILKLVAEQGGPDVLAELHNEFGDVPKLPEDFYLELRSSFLEPNETIGLELIEALESLDPEKKYFEHHLMLESDKENFYLWTEDYFKKLFSSLEATKIWACGPPIMQECFDRAAFATPNAKVEFAAL